MHKKMFRFAAAGAAAALLAAALMTGCGKKQDTETPPVATLSPAETKEETQPETTAAETQASNEDVGPDGMVRSYLTGEWKDPAVARRRPIAVMISNVLAAQPTYGVSQASVVVEAPNEASAVRFLALFEDYDDLKEIGSIRSARTYHTLIQSEFEAIFFHYGQSAYALPYLEFGAEHGMVDDVNGVTGASEWAYHTMEGRESPHHHFTNAEEINYAIERMGFTTQYHDYYEGRFRFVKDDETPSMPGASECTRVDVGYVSNKPWFEYNEEDGLYYRYQFGEAHIDAGNKEQVTAKNIIIQVCDYEHYDDTDYLNIHVWGENIGKYITDGKVIDITWKKDTDWDITHYYDMEGNEIQLNQGKTWLFIVRTERQKYVSINGESIVP